MGAQSYSSSTSNPYGQQYGQQYDQQYGQQYQQPYDASAQQQYGVPTDSSQYQYGAPQQQPSSAPFVLSIIALVSAVLGLLPVSIILAIIALVMNSNQKKRGFYSTKQKPTFIMSIISIVLSIVITVIMVILGVGIWAMMEEEGYSVDVDSSGSVTLTTPSSGSVTFTSSGSVIESEPESSASASASSASAASSGTALGGSLTANSSASAQPAATQDASGLVGVWEIDSMIYDGEETSGEDLDLMRELGMNVTLELREDGTMELDLFGEGVSGTWKANSENSITITMEGETINATVSDGILMLVEDSDVLSFHKM